MRVSEAARADACACDAVALAASIPERDAEKGAHKLLNHFGLSLRVKVSWVALDLNGELLRIPYLKPSDYLKKLLDWYPDVVWGDGVKDSSQRCTSFWKAYYWSHPTHKAFSTFSYNGLGQLLPIQLHGDEGTGSKKQPVSIMNWQTVWGRSTKKTEHLQGAIFGACQACSEPSSIERCCTVPQTCPKGTCASMQLTSEDYKELQGQLPTSAGHSFLQRHLVFVLPTNLLKKGPEVLEAVLSACAADLEHLFNFGVNVGGKQVFAAVVGCKGDAKWHAATGHFTRCYSRLGDTKSYPICPECLGGDPAFPFEATNSEPGWVQTLYESVPWNDPGQLERIPFDQHFPARKYKRDLLHVFKIGLARDITGSGIVFLRRRLRWKL